MGAAFTPGPWKVDPGQSPNPAGPSAESYVYAPNGPSSDNNDVATVYAGGYTRDDADNNARQEANARLIAAAPEGYAIAERLVAHLREDFHIPATADEGWIVDTLGHCLGGIYLDALSFLAKARGES
jgi:hypothetical protein